MKTNKEGFSEELVAGNGSNIKKSVDIAEYQRQKSDSLGLFQQRTLNKKRGKELEKHLFDMYSSKIEKEKEQLNHQLVIELDIAKKRLTEDYFKALIIIETNLSMTIDNMLRENIESTAKSIDSHYDLCDKLRDNAQKYKESHPQRYQRIMEDIERKESKGVELINERNEELINKHHTIFQQTTELLSQTKEKYE